MQIQTRPSHLRDAASGKRILLTAKILGDMQYQDPDVLDLSFPSVARLRSSSNPGC